MQVNRFIRTASIGLASALCVASFSTEVNAEESGKQIFCDTTGSAPLTVVQEGDISNSLIIWQSDYWSGKGLSPATRCQIISKRLSDLYTSGGGDFLIGVGRINGEDVICATETQPYFGEYPCKALILTLEPGDNPALVFQQFVEAATAASGTPLVRNSNTPVRFSTWVENSPSVSEAINLEFERN